MKATPFFCVALSGLFASAALASPRSDLPAVRGLKFPNSPMEGVDPVETFAMRASLLPEAARARVGRDPVTGLPFRYEDLTDHLLPSPDQDEAGSCLYMALTGAAEFFLNRQRRFWNPFFRPRSDGPTDLSERYFMGLNGVDESDSNVPDWRTDMVYMFNQNSTRARAGVLNRNYRFTKGWYVNHANGDLQPSHEGAEGASYGTSFNWIEGWNEVAEKRYVRLPEFSREVLYADANRDQWATGTAPADAVERIKESLVRNRAPVVVIYNHFRYWHAVLIVGYKDDAETTCPFVNRFVDYMKQKAAEARQQAEVARAAGNLAEATRLERAAAKTERAALGTEQPYQAAGGCSGKGTFLVRDSIYGLDSEPAYDYDPTRTDDDGHYSKLLVEHEYEWVRYMTNHAFQVKVAKWH